MTPTPLRTPTPPAPRDAVLSPARRQASLDALTHGSVDVVIIGGGVTGVGCALDAASRGLTVALIEQRDFASGTSSRSSKLIHGGLRYLEQFDFGLVFEALQERSLLVNELAPHLVEPVRFLYPLRHRVWERVYVGAGVGLYDLFASRGDNPLPRHQHLSAAGVAQAAPGLDPNSYIGAVVYSDAKVDDARHTLAVARSAAARGAHILTSTRVCGIRREAGRVVGVDARCLESGRDLSIDAGVVINATGVWNDDIAGMLGAGELQVRASKGIHLTVPRDRFDAGSGIILRTEKSVLFIIPWHDQWIIGTTDTDWHHDLAHPAASRADIDYLLERVNAVVTRQLTIDDIQGVYAGLRPLVSAGAGDTTKLSREHAIGRPVPGFVTVAGGKYTTYRVMAADAVDAALDDLGCPSRRSVTEHLPLHGAVGFHALQGQAAELAADVRVGLADVEHLLGRHGSAIGEVLDLIEDDERLGRRLSPDHPYLLAEAVHAARSEGALHLDDVLTRRMRLSFESWDRATASADQVAALMGEVHGWTNEQIASEVEHYQARVAAERASQVAATDAAADEVRRAAGEIRTGAL